MTIASTMNRVNYVGNGVTTSFSVIFPFHSQGDLVVLSTVILSGVQTIKTITTHYTISGTPDALGHYNNGGSVDFTVAPAGTERITIYRDGAETQSLDLVENDNLPAKSLEAAIDYQTMLIQRVADLIGRSLRQPDGDSDNIGTLPSKVDRASKFLACDADGEVIGAAGSSGVPVSTFMETVLDDTTAAAARTTLAASGLTPSDAVLRIVNTLDATKQIAFNAIGIATGTVRTIEMPNMDVTLMQRLCIDKLSDESVTSSTVLQNDDDLLFVIEAGEYWSAQVYIPVGDLLSTTGIKIAVTCPALGTIRYTAQLVGSASGKAAALSSAASGTTLDFTAASLAGCTTGFVTLNIHVINGANAGTVHVQWAQSTSSGTALTAKQGAVLNATRTQ